MRYPFRAKFVLRWQVEWRNVAGGSCGGGKWNKCNYDDDVENEKIKKTKMSAPGS